VAGGREIFDIIRTKRSVVEKPQLILFFERSLRSWEATTNWFVCS